MKKKFNLSREYKKCWKYISDSKKFIFFIAFIFFVFSLVSFLFPVPKILSEQILKIINEILKETEGLSRLNLIAYIIFNNIQSSFFGILLGFALGIFPLFYAIVNGYVLGFISAISVQTTGYSSLLQLLPHGIFEFPAIFISLGIGLKFGTFIFQKDKKKSFKNYLINSLRIFLLIILPLLLIAGIIEGTLMAV